MHKLSQFAGNVNRFYSASAFHWIPEEIGYEKVFSLLKNGGVFARFANHPFRCKDNPALVEEIDRIYGDYYYKFHNRKQEPPQEYTEEESKDRAQIAEKYGFNNMPCSAEPALSRPKSTSPCWEPTPTTLP